MNHKDRLLTEVELELMTVIWKLGEATVKDVVEQLSEERKLAYTTVATVIKILEQKNFLECQKDSYAHIFRPIVSKFHYEKTCLDQMVSNVFDGKPVALVQRLLHSKKLSQPEIKAIEEALKGLARTGRSKK